MSAVETKQPPSLIDAAKAVVEAWREYLVTEGQLVPHRLCDEPKLMGDLEAAIEADERGQPRAIIASLVAAAETLLAVIAEPNAIVQDMGMDNAIQAMADAITSATAPVTEATR